MWKFHDRNIGEFIEVEFGKSFTYRAVGEQNYNPYNLPHVVDVLDGIRFAIVKKTVAYVVVDEDAQGQPVFEKWEIRSHKTYD